MKSFRLQEDENPPEPKPLPPPSGPEREIEEAEAPPSMPGSGPEREIIKGM